MAAPLFRRGDVIGQKYYVLTKSGEAALWVGFLACTVDAQQAAESRGEVPEPDLLLKVVRPELLESPGAADKLVRHLQPYKELSHPFLAQIVDVMTLPEQNSALVAEVSQVGQGGQGVLLDRMAVFRQKEGLPLADVLQIIDQLAEALTYLHEQGRLHGDLRLDSVLLKTDGVRLGDVGLGIGLPREPFLLLLANVGQMDSVAPELHAARPPDLRTDVFGLARMMRSLLELGDNWPIIRDSNQQLVEVISRALSTDPADRQPSISALIGELEKALQPDSGSAETTEHEVRTPPAPSAGTGTASEPPASHDSAGFGSSRSSMGPEWPPGSVLVSWRALAATVILAALVGALLAVAVMLLRRSGPPDWFKPTPPPVTLYLSARPSPK